MTLPNAMTYLFSIAGLAALRSFVHPAVLFAFDLDGTLAPIVENPGRIQIPEAIQQELLLLKQRATVAVITGRSRADALDHLGIVPHHLIGNHGAEGLPGWEEQEEEFRHLGMIWERQLLAMFPAAEELGLVIENKGQSISIHYRKAESSKEAPVFLLNGISSLIPQPRRISGKYLENLLPQTAPDKGTAIRQLMNQVGCTRGFFAGDDETDEDVFRLAGDQLFCVRVGYKIDSRARYYLHDQQEIPLLLRCINDALEEATR